MIVGYDSWEKKVVLFAYPEELEELAQKMRQQQATALGGDDTQVVSLPIKDFYNKQQPLDTTLDICYQQKF